MGLRIEETVRQRGARLGALLRRERGLTALVTMAIVGFAVAVYLTAVHYLDVPLACPANALINCAQVTSSAYSVVPGTQIPITIPGMLWFIVSGGLAVVALACMARERLQPVRLRLIQLLWGAAGLLFVLYLVYCEIVLLHRLCEWCTVVHLLTLATFLVALSRWQQEPTPVLARKPRTPHREHLLRTTPQSTNAHAPRASATLPRSRRAMNAGATSKAHGKRR